MPRSKERRGRPIVHEGRFGPGRSASFIPGSCPNRASLACMNARRLGITIGGVNRHRKDGSPAGEGRKNVTRSALRVALMMGQFDPNSGWLCRILL